MERLNQTTYQKVIMPYCKALDVQYLNMTYHKEWSFCWSLNKTAYIRLSVSHCDSKRAVWPGREGKSLLPHNPSWISRKQTVSDLCLKTKCPVGVKKWSKTRAWYMFITSAKILIILNAKATGAMKRSLNVSYERETICPLRGCEWFGI